MWRVLIGECDALLRSTHTVLRCINRYTLCVYTRTTYTSTNTKVDVHQSADEHPLPHLADPFQDSEFAQEPDVIGGGNWCQQGED